MAEPSDPQASYPTRALAQRSICPLQDWGTLWLRVGGWGRGVVCAVGAMVKDAGRGSAPGLVAR